MPRENQLSNNKDKVWTAEEMQEAYGEPVPTKEADAAKDYKDGDDAGEGKKKETKH